MDDLEIIINNLLTTLERINLGENVSVIREFPSRTKDNPLKKTTVSYGIKKISAFYDFDTYGDQLAVDTVLGFTVHAPVTSSGENCRSVFIDIIKYLYPLVPMLIDFGCGELKFNRSTSTIELEGYGTVRNLI